MGVPIIEGLTSKVPDGNHDDGDQISEMAIDFETEYFGGKINLSFRICLNCVLLFFQVPI